MRVRVSLWAGCALGVALAACSRPADPTTWSPLASDDPTLDQPWDVQRIAARVAEIRHVTVKEPIAVETIDASGLSKRYGDHEMDRHIFETDSVWHAFAFAAPDVSVGAQVRAGYVANTAGLYDVKERRLFLRAGDTSSRDERHTLVHEIEHALQHQNFGPTGPYAPFADAMRARTALVEGDADVTVAAYAAAMRRTNDHWIAQALDAIQRGAWNHVTSKSPKADGLIPLSKTLREFPYRAGDLFVGSMYRLGGFEMVDRIFSHVPLSTEQVMHPDRYLSGDAPVPVAKPMAPEGYVDVDSGRMGELLLSALLGQCGGARADDAVGWGGDAYSVVTDYAGKIAVLVSTVWDDVAAATRFEGRIAARGACLAAKGGPDPRSPVDVAVLREGDRVAFVEGVEAGARDATLHSLLALVGARPPPAPPFGAECALPPLVVPGAFLKKGAFEGARYFSAPLGLVVPLTTFEGETSEENELALSHRDAVSAVHAHLRIALTSLTPELERRVVVSTSEQRDPSLTYEGVEPIAVGRATGRAYLWMHGEYKQHVAVLAPFCDGLGTIEVDAAFGGRGAWSDLAELLAKIDLDDDAPACLWLKANRGEPTPPKTCALP